MKLKMNLIVLIFLFGSSALMFGRTITLDELLNVYALQSPTVKTLRLQYANSLLEYENYRKGFLPSVSFDITPISFNRSLRLLQDPYSGKYTYVKEYENSIAVQIQEYNQVYFSHGLVEKAEKLAREQYRLAAKKNEKEAISVYELSAAFKTRINAATSYFNSLQSLFSRYFTLRHLSLYDYKMHRNLEEMY